jgi:hypothetical protein
VKNSKQNGKKWGMKKIKIRRGRLRVFLLFWVVEWGITTPIDKLVRQLKN